MFWKKEKVSKLNENMFWNKDGKKEKISDLNDMIPLKNGTEVKAHQINTVMEHLRRFIQEDPKGFIQFVNQCRFPEEKNLHPENLPLQGLYRNLIDMQGTIPQYVKDIVLSSINGVGINLYIDSPIANNGILYTHSA